MKFARFIWRINQMRLVAASSKNAPFKIALPFPKITMALAVLILTACGGKPSDEGSSDSSSQNNSSSNSVSSSSSVSSQSSSSVSSVDVSLGESIFLDSCEGCHGTFSDGVSNGTPSINVDNFTYDNKAGSNFAETQSGLAGYIDADMAAFCGGGCGEDVAAYMWSMRSGTNNPTTTNYADFTADISNGEQIFELTCQSSGCHGEAGRGENSISFARYKSASDFHKYIEPAMPRAPDYNPADCVGQCSVDVSAYLWSVRPVAAQCTVDDGVLFAKQTLPLLTPQEYKNSIRDLFAFISPNAVVPEDYLKAPNPTHVGSFPHTLRAQVSEDGSAKRLFDNAVAIADWNALPGNRFVNCSSTNASTCASEFIDGFAKMAFRRPLKTTPGPGETVSEVEYFQRIFQQAPSMDSAIKWAVAGTLNAPQFIYRSELGVPVSEALSNPLFEASVTGGSVTSGDLGDYEASGSGVTVNGVDFSTKQSSGGGNVGEVSQDSNSTFKLYTNGYLGHNFQFSGPAILTVEARGNDYNNTWPLMQILVGGNLIAAEEVATPGYADDYRLFNYLITDVSGSAEVRVQFNNDGGIQNAMGAPGTDIDLYLAKVTVAPARLKQGNQPEPDDTVKDFSDHLASLANDNTAYVLDPFEFAAVLSYMITGSTPDPQLMQAAESGALNARAGVEQQVERMFASPRAERNMKDFVALWMQTQELFKNTALGELDANVDMRDLMLTELQEFFWHIVSNDEVPFSEFYTAQYSFLNKRLADHYGIVWNGGNENQFVKTPFSDSDKRGGITTMGAFLAGHAHDSGSAPILRGVHVREDLLCHHIVPPGSIDEPEGVREAKQKAADEAAANGGLTTRRYFEISTSSPEDAPLTGCGQCHYYDINPVGAAMADFDGFGRFRSTQIPEGGSPSDNPIMIDALAGPPNNPGEGIRGLESFQNYDEVSGAVEGGRALSLMLGQTQAVQSCMVEKAFRSVLSRPITHAAIDLINRDIDIPLNDYESPSFVCAQEILSREFESSGQDIKVLFKELGNLSLIRFRRP